MSVGLVLILCGCNSKFQAAKPIGQDSLASTSPTLPEGASAPTIAFVKSPPALTNSRSVTATFSVQASQNGSLISVTCQLKGSAGNEAEDCAKGSVSYSGLQDGDYVISVTATDDSGQVIDAQAAFRVDAIAPQVIVTQAPATSVSSTDATIAFTAMDNLSGLFAVECALDSDKFAVCNSPVKLNGLSAQKHSFKIRATDQAKNVSEVINVSWTVDTSTPTLSISQRPNALTNSRTANFVFSGTKGGVALSDFMCSLDGAMATACISPISYSNLSEGNHVFTLIGVDSFGSRSPPTTISWTVDLTPPAVPSLTANINSVTKQTSASISFSSVSSGSGIADYQCAFDNSAFATCTSPRNFSGLAEGNHIFQVKAIDGAGNVSTVGSFSWMVDVTGPQLSITGMPGNPTTSTQANFTFSSSDTGSGVQGTSCQLDAASFIACSASVSYMGLSVGAHKVSIQSTDKAGNQKIVSYIWTVSVPELSISMISNQTTIEGPTATSQATFTASVYGPGAITCQWQIDSGSGFSSIAGATSCSSYTTGLGATSYNGYRYRMIATNSNGSTVSNVAIWTVTPGPYYFATAAGGASSGLCTRAVPCTVAYAQAKARSQMQPVYLLAGTYYPGVIQLTSADNGATWSGDWVTNSSYPFQTILDGRNSVEEIFWIQGGSNITIQYMKIQNAKHMGVCIHGGSRYQDSYHPDCTGGADTGPARNNTVQNVELYNFPTDERQYANVGCISLDGNAPNTRILNNYCHHTGGMGVRGGMKNADHDITGLVISGNVILNTMQSNLDGAPLYFTTFISHTALPVANVATITNNFIRDYGNGLTGNPIVSCVYFDSGNSGMTFKNNVCAPSGNTASSTTVFAYELNCGKNNVVDNNIFDLGNNPTVGFVLGGNACGVPGGPTDMSGNSISHNVVISKFKGTRVVSSGNGGTNSSDIRICGSMPVPQRNAVMNGLLSYNYGGGTVGSSVCGTATLTNQVISNPSFNVLAPNPYQLNANSPAFGPSIGFTGIPSSWGPKVPGFVLPPAGPNSSPSYL